MTTPTGLVSAPPIPITTSPIVFTPPSSCASSWTYEARYYNKNPHGILVQNLNSIITDSECLPLGFNAEGRVPLPYIFTPAICPMGYTTAVNEPGRETLAICCSQGYDYHSGMSAVGGDIGTFRGCTSYWTGSTQVPARAWDSVLTSTTINGTFLQWAQPITVRHRQDELSLFSTSPETTSSSTQTTLSSTHSPNPHSSVSSSPSSSSVGGLSTGATIGVAAGLGIFILLFVMALILFILHRRRKRRREVEEEQLGSESISAEGGISEIREHRSLRISPAELGGLDNELGELATPNPLHELPGDVQKLQEVGKAGTYTVE